MSDNRIKVTMRPFNASGVRAGMVLVLPKDQALDWLERGWCDRVAEEKPTQKKNHDQEG